MAGGVRVVNVALPPPVPGLQHALITWRLARRALAEQPDVLHCFKPKAYSGLVASLIWWLKRLRLSHVRLVVDTDDWEGPGGWNELEPYPWLARWFFAWQERSVLTHCDAITVASRALEILVWALGVQPDRVHYVPNGARLCHHRDADGRRIRARFNLGGAPVILLYTRFVEFDVRRVVEILQHIVAQVPDVRLLVVGQGLRGEEQDLIAQARAAGMTSQVVCAGWVPEEELADFFAAADVAMYPYDDTLINRTKCAVRLTDLMAAGVPVVADAVGQNAVYLDHGESGWLVPPGDTAAFVQALARLLADAELRRRMGAAARRRVEEEFSWDRLVLAVEAAYGLGEAGAAPG
jgi:glycosyltransferase involved in cell wall biosynthesis